MFSRSMKSKETKSIWTAKPKFHLLWVNQFSLSLSIGGAVLLIGIWANRNTDVIMLPIRNFRVFQTRK